MKRTKPTGSEVSSELESSRRRTFIRRFGTATAALAVTALVPAEALADKKPKFKDQVRQDLADIKTLVSEGGMIQQQVNQLQSDLMLIAARVDKCSNMFGDQDLRALRQTLDEISHCIRIP